MKPKPRAFLDFRAELSFRAKVLVTANAGHSQVLPVPPPAYAVGRLTNDPCPGTNLTRYIRHPVLNYALAAS